MSATETQKEIVVKLNEARLRFLTTESDEAPDLGNIRLLVERLSDTLPENIWNAEDAFRGSPYDESELDGYLAMNDNAEGFNTIAAQSIRRIRQFANASNFHQIINHGTTFSNAVIELTTAVRFERSVA